MHVRNEGRGPLVTPGPARSTLHLAGLGPSPELLIDVPGRIAGQGSKRRGQGGAVFESSPRTRPWRALVTLAATEATAATGAAWQPLSGPLAVVMTFTAVKPKSAPKTKRTWPITRAVPDIDKCQRAILDALTDANVWRDDSQVITAIAHQRYPNDPDIPYSRETPGATITVWKVINAQVP